MLTGKIAVHQIMVDDDARLSDNHPPADTLPRPAACSAASCVSQSHKHKGKNDHIPEEKLAVVW